MSAQIMSFALLTNIALYVEFQSATTFFKKMKLQVSFWYQNAQKDVVYTSKDTKTQKNRISNFSLRYLQIDSLQRESVVSNLNTIIGFNFSLGWQNITCYLRITQNISGYLLLFASDNMLSRDI